MQNEISVWKNWGPLKKHEETVKTRMRNSTKNSDKKSTKTGHIKILEYVGREWKRQQEIK